MAADQGQLFDAAKHLQSSATIWADYRISSYGPSFLLAKKLCERRMWEVVEQFLFGCKNLWNDEILDDWIQEVKNKHILDFDEP